MPPSLPTISEPRTDHYNTAGLYTGQNRDVTRPVKAIIQVLNAVLAVFDLSGGQTR